MIRPRDSLQLALRAITAHRLRSFLTLLGIAVGIAAVILLTSIGEGIHRFVLAEFTQFGTNVISVAPGKTKTSGHAPTGIPTSVRPLTLDDARALSHLPHITGMTATVWGNTEVNANGRLRRTTVNGVSADMLKVFSIKVRSGQFLPAEDADNCARLHRSRRKAQGRVVRYRQSAGCPRARRRHAVSRHRRPRSQGAVPGHRSRRRRLHPDRARARTLQPRRDHEDRSVVRGRRAAAGVSALVKATLKARHGREDFTITTQEDMLRTLSNILDVLTMAVGALGSISLLVGGVGIVTIMTIAVTERTGEIGLLVALGAPRRTILGLFLGEAVALSALGGLLGLLLGFGLAQLIHLLVPALPVHTPLSFVALAELIAVRSACWPGCCRPGRAARLNAVDALSRAE
jgi:putative ABC transport system permease protein